jgi:hypothetical protein
VTLPRAILHDILISRPFIWYFRDRLRCPTCRKVGTWKPRGPVGRADGRIIKRRWLCKWCGAYDGEGERDTGAFINKVKGYWDIRSCHSDESWPQVEWRKPPHNRPEDVACDPWLG